MSLVWRQCVWDGSNALYNWQVVNKCAERVAKRGLYFQCRYLTVRCLCLFFVVILCSIGRCSKRKSTRCASFFSFFNLSTCTTFNYIASLFLFPASSFCNAIASVISFWTSSNCREKINKQWFHFGRQLASLLSVACPKHRANNRTVLIFFHRRRATGAVMDFSCSVSDRRNSVSRACWRISQRQVKWIFWFSLSSRALNLFLLRCLPTGSLTRRSRTVAGMLCTSYATWPSRFFCFFFHCKFDSNTTFGLVRCTPFDRRGQQCETLVFLLLCGRNLIKFLRDMARQ